MREIGAFEAKYRLVRSRAGASRDAARAAARAAARGLGVSLLGVAER